MIVEGLNPDYVAALRNPDNNFARIAFGIDKLTFMSKGEDYSVKLQLTAHRAIRAFQLMPDTKIQFPPIGDGPKSELEPQAVLQRLYIDYFRAINTPRGPEDYMEAGAVVASLCGCIQETLAQGQQGDDQ